jgi:hypothetical protein
MMKSMMKMVMRVVAFFTPWAIAAVIAWMAYSVGHSKGYTEGRIYEDRLVEWREAVEKAYLRQPCANS